MIRYYFMHLLNMNEILAQTQRNQQFIRKHLMLVNKEKKYKRAFRIIHKKKCKELEE